MRYKAVLGFKAGDPPKAVEPSQAPITLQTAGAKKVLGSEQMELPKGIVQKSGDLHETRMKSKRRQRVATADAADMTTNNLANDPTSGKSGKSGAKRKGKIQTTVRKAPTTGQKGSGLKI